MAIEGGGLAHEHDRESLLPLRSRRHEYSILHRFLCRLNARRQRECECVEHGYLGP